MTISRKRKQFKLWCVLVGMLHLNISANDTLIFSAPEDSFIQDISIAVLQKAYEKMGYSIAISKLPNPRSLSTANRGQVDGEISRIAGIEEKHSQLIQVPVAINYLQGMAFSDKPGLTINSWEALRDYKLICIKSVLFVEKELTKRNIKCEYVSTIHQAINMIELKRGEVLVLPRLNGTIALRQHDNRTIKPVGVGLNSYPLYHYLHQKNAYLLSELSDVLNEMVENGETESIRTKHLVDNHIPLSID